MQRTLLDNFQAMGKTGDCARNAATSVGMEGRRFPVVWPDTVRLEVGQYSVEYGNRITASPNQALESLRFEGGPAFDVANELTKWTRSIFLYYR